MSSIVTETSSIVSVATLATIDILCFSFLTAIFMITASYLGKPLGLAIFSCAYTVAGWKNDPTTEKEARVLASLLVIPCILIDLVCKSSLNRTSTGTSEVWLGSPVLAYIGSVCLRAGLKVILTITLLSAIVSVGRSRLEASTRKPGFVKN